MKRTWLKVIVAMVTILGVAGCAQMKRDEPPAPSAAAATPVTMEEDFEEGYQDLALMVDGVEIGALAEDPEALRKKVIELLDTDDPDPDRIRAWLNTLRSREGNWADVPPSLRGLASFPVAQLLETYLASQASAYLKRRVRGKIRDYLFDEPEEAGHLSVDTWVEYFDSAASFAAKTPDRTERYHWDIDVMYGFRVIPRDDSKPNNPFPGTLQTWPQPLLDRIFNGVPTAIPPKPPLVNKLWAKGKGIVVRNVYEVNSDTSVNRLPDTDARYVPTDASCIDMMWAGAVPAVITPAFKTPNYCLGRCDQPEVVNTD